MQITHLGHAAVLIEAGGARILIDPGNFSQGWHDQTELDAIFITHLHPDHVDPEHVPALVKANPEAQIFVEPGVPKTCEIPGANAFPADSKASLGGLEVTAVGGTHAVIHRDIPMIGNVGLVFRGEGEPTFFHPGDSLATIPEGVDIAAIPAYGPWAAMKETVDFVREVNAAHGFPIHDGLLNDRGWNLIFGRLNDMTDTTVEDLRDKPQHRF